MYRRMQFINNTVNPFFYSRHISLDIKHSSADEVTADHRDTITSHNRSVVAVSAGSRTRVQQALDASSHQPWPWSGLGVTLVNLLWSLRVTSHNRSVVAGSRTRVQHALDASSHQPWPWSGLGVTLVNLLWSLRVMRSHRDA